MLQKIHENVKGWVASIIIGLLCFTFVLWGIQFYVEGDHRGGKVIARVDGEKITEPQVLMLFRQLQRSVSANGTLLNDEINTQLKQLALQNLVAETALSRAAKKSGFLVTEDQAEQIIRQMPDFQQNGKFSTKKFRQFLYGAQLTQSAFLRQLQKNMLINQVQGGIEQSDFVLPEELTNSYYLTHQQRSFSYLVVPAGHVKKVASITSKQINTYYDNHKEQFRVPDKVSIAYLIMSPKENEGERLADLAFTNPDTLEPAAKALALKIQHSQLFTTEGTASGVTSNPRVVAAAFSDDVLQQGNNSSPISLKDGSLLVLRVEKHEASSIPSLSRVETQVRDQLVKQTQQADAALLAGKLERQLRQGASGATLAQKNQLQWVVKNKVDADNAKDIPDAVLNRAFSLSLAKDDKVATVALEDGSTAVVQLNDINHLTFSLATEKQRKSFRDEMQQFFAGLNYRLYVDDVKDHTSVRVDAAPSSTGSD